LYPKEVFYSDCYFEGTGEKVFRKHPTRAAVMA
jgi:hypothetical protein